MKTINVSTYQQDGAECELLYLQTITCRKNDTDTFADDMLAATDRFCKLFGLKPVSVGLQASANRDDYICMVA